MRPVRGKGNFVTNKNYIPTGLVRVPSERERQEEKMREKDRLQREARDRVKEARRDTNSHGKGKDR